MGVSFPSMDIWQWLETCLVALTLGEGRSQSCCPEASYNAQDRAHSNHTAQQAVCTVVEKLAQTYRTESITLKPVLERAE